MAAAFTAPLHPSLPFSPKSLPYLSVKSPTPYTLPPTSSLRRHLLGPAALAHESALLQHHSPSLIAITRIIVIHADYLSDLAVVDLVHDLSTSTTYTTFLASALGFLLSLPFADLLSALSTWLRSRILPPGAFNILPAYAPTRKDLFFALVNSCAFCTPLLTLLACWAEHAQGDVNNIFVESFGIGVLSLTSIEPLVRQGEYECDLVKWLRNNGFIRAGKWGTFWGLWDSVLRFEGVESALRQYGWRFAEDRLLVQEVDGQNGEGRPLTDVRTDEREPVMSEPP